MYYYAYSLRQARFIMVNSSWTKGHVDSILQYTDRLLDAIHLLPPLVLLQILSRKRSDCPESAQIVYPSCDTRQMAVFALKRRERVILSIAQFRCVASFFSLTIDMIIDIRQAGERPRRAATRLPQVLGAAFGL